MRATAGRSAKGAVREVLQDKGKQVWGVTPQTSVEESLRVMADKNIGAVLVMDRGRVVGVFSERDFARKALEQGRDWAKTQVRQLMCRPVLYVTPETSVEECMAIMSVRHVRHLPVLEGREVVGVVSIGDVVNKVITEQTLTLRELENFLKGRGLAP